MDVIEQPRRIDAHRYSWETWCDDGAIIVGLLDGHDAEHKPMLVAASLRDADILLAVLRALDIKALGGLPFDPVICEGSYTQRWTATEHPTHGRCPTCDKVVAINRATSALRAHNADNADA